VRLRVPIVAFCAASATLLSGCAGFTRWPWSYTQRWPGPMTPQTSPLPPGDRGLFAEGPEEVLVQRHADPVQVRPAGLMSSYPLRFYAKSKALRAGSSIYTGAGGRAEVLFPDGGSITLFGTGVGIVGSTSRGEPLFRFQQLDRALVTTAAPARLHLVGGSELRLKGGPVLVESLRADLLRVLNQSKAAVEVATREVVITLDPGDKVDLPVIGEEGAPRVLDSAWTPLEASPFAVRTRGSFERLEDVPGSIRLRSQEQARVGAFGLEVSLGLDEEVRLAGLDSLSPLPAAPVKP
jgi:hypothetical protein